MDAQQSAERRRRALSALMDGEDAAAGEFPASTAAAAGESVCRWVCESWRGDGELREDWHAYHLIGDVLRSDDLAIAPARDEALLIAIRARLADEPVVLAPWNAADATAADAVFETPRQALGLVGAAGIAAAGVPRRRSWLAPGAVAAGFVAVAGVVVALRGLDSDDRARTLAAAGPSVASVAAQSAPSSTPAVALSAGAGAAALLGGRRALREAQLTPYLAAHKQYGGSAAFAMPVAGFSAAYGEAPQR